MKAKALKEIKHILQEHKSILAKEFHIKEINLFGSYV